MLKINVEGMELDVLKGAKELLRSHMPKIYIECLNAIEFRNVFNFLERFGYIHWDVFNASPTHLFIHKSGIDQCSILNRLAFQNVVRSYATANAITRNINDTNRCLRSANKVYNVVNQHTKILKELDPRIDYCLEKSLKIENKYIDSLTEIRDKLTLSHHKENDETELQGKIVVLSRQLECLQSENKSLKLSKKRLENKKERLVRELSEIQVDSILQLAVALQAEFESMDGRSNNELAERVIEKLRELQKK